jgi:hypothetical protein
MQQLLAIVGDSRRADLSPASVSPRRSHATSALILEVELIDIDSATREVIRRG